MKNTVSIVMAVDEAFVRKLFVSLQSAISCKEPDTFYEIYILRPSRFTEQSELGFQRLVDAYPSQVSIRFIDMGTRYQYAPITLSHISVPTFYRLALPELLPQLDRCIYLDADIIVCGDLRELFETPLQDYLIAGVPDAQFNRSIDYPRQIGLSTNALYINAGVLLMNLQRMRDERFSDRCARLANHPFMLQDQDIINYIAQGRIARLPYRYNIAATQNQFAERVFAMYSADEICEAQANPRIIHFMMDQKPWNTYAPENPFNEQWWSIARKTPFYEELLVEFAPSVSTRLERRIAEITDSKAYRIGTTLSAPVRLIRQWTMKQKQARFVKGKLR